MIHQLEEQLNNFVHTLNNFDKAEETMSHLLSRFTGTPLYPLLEELEQQMETFAETLEDFENVETALLAVKNSFDGCVQI